MNDSEEREPKELGPEPVDITGKEPVPVETESLIDILLKEASTSTDEKRIERTIGVLRRMEPERFDYEVGEKKRFTVHNLGADYRDHLRADFDDDDLPSDDPVTSNGANGNNEPTVPIAPPVNPDLEALIETRYQQALDQLKARHQSGVEKLGLSPRMAELFKE